MPAGPVSRRRSKVETGLPPELREEVNRLLVEGATYEEIATYCTAKGHDIGKSSIGRYGKQWLEMYRRVRIAEDKARAIQGEAGEGLALEEAASKMFVQQVLELLADGAFDLSAMPRVLSDFAKLQSASVAREKWKSEVARRLREAGEKVEAAVEEAGRESGGVLTVEEVRLRVRQAYGVET